MANEAAAQDADGLPDYCTAGVLVLGCGNPLMGDDGFGPAVAELLLKEQGAGRTAEDRPRAGLLGRDDRRSSTEAQGARLEAQGTRHKGQGDEAGAEASPESLAPCALRLAPSICVINAGTGSRGIIFNMVTGPARPKAIIIVDALEARKRPGELFWVDIEDMSLEKAEDFSLHMTPASNMLLELKKLGVEIRVLACEPKNLPEVMTEGLSSEVAAAVRPAAEMVLRAADEILKSA